MASGSMSRAPEVATITGSTTIFCAWYWRRRWAMARISGALDTMPILTASGRMSVKIMSSCWHKNSGLTSRMPLTPVVFWAVSAVMAVMA